MARGMNEVAELDEADLELHKSAGLVFAFHSSGAKFSAVSMKYCLAWLVRCVWALSCFYTPAVAERINQEGRILGALPVVTNSILFDTTNADAVVAAMQIFPVTNPWNECISNRLVLTNSDAMMQNILTNVGSSHRILELFQEMNYVLVPDNQPLVPFSFFGGYPDESDLNGGSYPVGLYPIPTNQPVEGWPTQLGETLAQAQTNDDGGDRHAIMVQPGTGIIYESWRTLLTLPSNWHATNGAIFNLNTNSLRPDGWTSGDAAGFPMFPALVRYDECERGMVEHACRLVVVKSLYGSYIYPATHFAAPSSHTNVNIPAMGQRLRLKASYVIPANWTKEEKALLLGLKKYGAMVCDNSSSFFSISITPDDRWGNAFNDLMSKGVGIGNFEVIQTTGPNEGPRSPGAPVVSAGPDTVALPGAPLMLQGAVVYSNSPPVIQWTAYSGPGAVTFGNASISNTTATFSAPGSYTLELSAADGVHAVAYDAMVVTVSNVVVMSTGHTGTNLNLNWLGGTGPFVVQATDRLSPAIWYNVATTSVQNVFLPLANTTGYFRIKSQ